MHLTDGRGGDRHRAPVEEELRRIGAELVADHGLGQARRHGRDVGLEGRERGLGLGRQPIGDEGDHLTRLHDRPLHVAEHLSHVLRGADGELLLEAGALFVGRPAAAQLHRRPVDTPPARESPHAGLALEPVSAVVVRQRHTDARAGDEAGRDAERNPPVQRRRRR